MQIGPSHTVTKVFALRGLLSGGLQDRQGRSAKRQEEVARETGASLVNGPKNPPLKPVFSALTSARGNVKVVLELR